MPEYEEEMNRQPGGASRKRRSAKARTSASHLGAPERGPRGGKPPKRLRARGGKEKEPHF